MKKILVKFESTEQVSLFTNTVLSDTDYKEVIEMFPFDNEAKVVCTPRLEAYNDYLLPSIVTALNDCGLSEAYYSELN